MNVFISYSVADTDLVATVANQIKEQACVNYWDVSKAPGKEIWPTIFSWIDAADLVLVLITDKTMQRAFSVGQEVGHAKKGGKQIIPLVTKEVTSTDLGCLSGITYIPLDTTNPGAALKAVQKELENLKAETHRLKELEEQKQKQGIFVLACLALLAFVFSKK